MGLSPQLLAGLASSAPLDDTAAKRLASAFSLRRLPRGHMLCHQGAPDGSEYLLLTGRAKSTATDAEGREVCLGLHAGPEVLTPHMARMAGGESLVDITLLDDAEIAGLSADSLLQLMVEDAAIRDWGNAIMRAELTRKTGREWALAALDAAGRLRWLRQHYPANEAQFPHALIASFLGMTPVTFSRALANA